MQATSLPVKKPLKLSEAEKKLYVKAQLVVGYYSLLRNLDLARTDEAAKPVVGVRFALAELTYLWAYRLSHLIVEFSKLCGDLDDFKDCSSQDTASQVKPGNLLHAVAVVYLGIGSIGPPEWNLPKTSHSHVVRRLEDELKTAYTFLLDSVRAYQCRLSAFTPGERTPSLPAIVDLVRTAHAGLPKHLVIDTSRLDDSGIIPHDFDPFPCLHGGIGQTSLVDILSAESGEILQMIMDPNLGDMWTPRQGIPLTLITDDNSKLDCSLDNVPDKSFSDRASTNVSTAQPQTATLREMSLALRQKSLFDTHPDPPRSHWGDLSILRSAGLQLDDEEAKEDLETNGSQELLQNSSTVLATWLVPEQWMPDFCHPDKKRKPEVVGWNPRPKNVTVPRARRKRKHAQDAGDGDSESDSSHPSKRRETYVPYNKEMMVFLEARNGVEGDLPYHN